MTTVRVGPIQNLSRTVPASGRFSNGSRLVWFRVTRSVAIAKYSNVLQTWAKLHGGLGRPDPLVENVIPGKFDFGPPY